MYITKIFKDILPHYASPVGYTKGREGGTGRPAEKRGLVGVMHSRNKQRTDQRVLVLTLKFLALKKTGFFPVKNTSQNVFDFCLPLFYATFQCGPYNIFKKKIN